MVARCQNEKRHAFADYGGRGIRVYERWLPDGTGQGVRNFLADLGLRPVAMTLNRIDPQGHYQPLNCRGADKETQANNQRRYWWPNGDMPEVESVRTMEARIAAFDDEINLL